MIDFLVAGLSVKDILLFRRMLDERDKTAAEFEKYVKRLELTLKVG